MWVEIKHLRRGWQLIWISDGKAMNPLKKLFTADAALRLLRGMIDLTSKLPRTFVICRKALINRELFLLC